jgi:hypothetical protein
MLTTNDVTNVYDTILSIPRMNDTVKIDLKISRKNVLLLHKVIERGLTLKQDGGGNFFNLCTISGLIIIINGYCKIDNLSFILKLVNNCVFYDACCDFHDCNI